MYIDSVAWLTCIGIAFAPSSSRSSAEASDSGLLPNCAPVASAAYSRWRETASWIRVAASGASRTSARLPISPSGDSSSPPNQRKK